MAKRRWKLEDIKSVVAGENPFIQSGYTGKKGPRKIGEVWTDAKGVTWKKTGADSVVRVNKQMDSIRDLIRPRCSVCDMDIFLFGDRNDKILHAKTGKCFSCLDIEETTLKVTGKYKEYENTKLLKNKLSLLKELRKNVKESIEYLKTDSAKIEMVCSNGDIVTWTGAQNESLLKEAESDLVKTDNEIKKTEEELSQLQVT